MDGLRVVGETEIGGVSEFAGSNGKQVYMLTLKGWGWQTNYLTEDVAETRNWGSVGDRMHLEAGMDMTKDGKFKLVGVRLTPVAKQQTRAASGQ